MDSLDFKTDMAFTYGVPSPMGPGITRIVAQNPGPFTFKGTNTYLVGSTSLAVIDPGPDNAAHRQAILKVAGSHRPQGMPIRQLFRRLRFQTGYRVEGR